MSTMMQLYSYFRSSAAYRVRIALNLKGLDYDIVPINLVRDGGQHKQAEYRAINPQMRVPALRLPNGEVLIQSLAIIEYLEEMTPNPPLLPADPVRRAHARAIAQIVACDIHPLNNSGTLAYIRGPLAQHDRAVDAWYAHWILTGLEAVEAMIAPDPYAFGSQVTVADLCIIPQLANARRFNLPIQQFPRLLGVEAACQQLAAFDRARPERQPDAE
jgi:maleylacetoacetate isomerase